MANSETFSSDSTVTTGNPTKSSNYADLANNTDYLEEALAKILVPADADGRIVQSLTEAAAAATKVMIDSKWDPASGTAANNQTIRWRVQMDDNAVTPNQTVVGALDWVMTDVVDASEDLRLDFYVITAGTLASELQLSGASLNPTTNDGLALGTTALGFSDFHLATGGVINWANGEFTITETSANLLTFAGGNIDFGAAIVFVNDTANVNMTTGITINQGAAIDTAFAIKSSGVTHGITTQEETDTYFNIQIRADGIGGAILIGFTESTQALFLDGAYTTSDITKTTVGTAAIELRALKKSGTTWAGVGVDDNMVIISDAAGAGTRFIFDAEGSGHADVGWVTYDAYDDFVLVRTVEEELLAIEHSAKTARRHMLEDARIIGKDSWHFENGKPRAMVNFTRLAMLHHGALLQAGEKFERIEAELSEERDRRMLLEARLAQIEERSRN